MNDDHCASTAPIYSNEFNVEAAPPVNQALCESTGGSWEPLSCGDYTCGEPPLCTAIIPGCDCGIFANFYDGLGCTDDLGCGQRCGGIAGIPCPLGATCEVEPGCFDCFGVCEPLFCGGATDPPCPAGMNCLFGLCL